MTKHPHHKSDEFHNVHQASELHTRRGPMRASWLAGANKVKRLLPLGMSLLSKTGKSIRTYFQKMQIDMFIINYHDCSKLETQLAAV